MIYLEIVHSNTGRTRHRIEVSSHCPRVIQEIERDLNAGLNHELYFTRVTGWHAASLALTSLTQRSLPIEIAAGR